MSSERQVRIDEFLEGNSVFRLHELAEARGSSEDSAREALRYHVAKRRVLRLERGLYLRQSRSERGTSPDPFLIAAALRPDAVCCHHSAFELLGIAQSSFRVTSVYSEKRRQPFRYEDLRIDFLSIPRGFRNDPTKAIDEALREGRTIRWTRAERTLVETLRRPVVAGGIDEVVSSLSTLPYLDFDLLLDCLHAVDEARTWASVGWLVERTSDRWLAPPDFLDRCRGSLPAQPTYLVDRGGGGQLISNWRLIVPEHLMRFEGS